MKEALWYPGESLEDVEEKVIKAALLFYKSKPVAADALKITVKTINNKLEKYAKRDQGANEDQGTKADKGQ